MALSFQKFLLTSCILSCLSLITPTDSAAPGYYVPITYEIPARETECIYERFTESGDMVTFSAFIVEPLDNGPPIAAISFEGPIAGNDDIIKMAEGEDGSVSHIKDLGQEINTGLHKHWPKVKDADKHVRYDKRVGIINRSLKVDWTHAGESEDAEAMRAQIEQEKKEAYRNYGRGPPSKDRDEEKEKFRIITAAKIEPYEETNTIKATGWYRLCVKSEIGGNLVEMEIRSGNQLGGVDRRTGHVYTYEEREMLDEEKAIDEGMTASEDENTYASEAEEIQKQLENQVKEQDMHATKAQIKHLNSMVQEMKKKHHDYHVRLKSHKATAQRNHGNMVWSSKLETLLYVLITGVQVYTVRKWLLSSSLLGT